MFSQLPHPVFLRTDDVNKIIFYSSCQRKI
jgi:hypothetical protein